MEKTLLEKFIEYAKEKYECDITLIPSDNPDTFKSIFGVSFIENTNQILSEELYGPEIEVEYNDISIERNISINIQDTTFFENSIQIYLAA
jgi:hypothetical protein